MFGFSSVSVSVSEVMLYISIVMGCCVDLLVIISVQSYLIGRVVQFR